MMHNEGNDFQLLCECVKISCTKNMGNLKTVYGAKTKKNLNKLPLIESKDSEIIQMIWKTVEKDSTYYGFAMCTILFKTYPRYAKYFEDEAIPEFIREAKVKKKFSIIFDIIAALFASYNVKPAERNHLLGYIAMQHKDMGLTLRDFNNFTSCIVEALSTELPQLMTPENIIMQMKYFNIVSESIILLIEKYNAKIDHMSHTRSKDNKICSPCFTHRTETMYNYPLKYWLYKKRYWEYRRAVWASLEMGPAVGTAAVITDYRKMHLQTHRKPIETRRSIRRRRRSTPPKKDFSSNSDLNTNDNGKKRKEKRKFVPGTWEFPNVLTKKQLYPNTVPKQLPNLMKTIHEVQHDKTLRDGNRVTKNESSKIQKNYESTLPMPAKSQLEGTTVTFNRNDAARERKRQRDHLVSLTEDTS